MNYATERLLVAAKASLIAWEAAGLFPNQREPHAEVIEELEMALLYFERHGEKPAPAVDDSYEAVLDEIRREWRPYPGRSGK